MKPGPEIWLLTSWSSSHISLTPIISWLSSKPNIHCDDVSCFKGLNHYFDWLFIFVITYLQSVFVCCFMHVCAYWINYEFSFSYHAYDMIHSSLACDVLHLFRTVFFRDCYWCHHFLCWLLVVENFGVSQLFCVTY